MLWVVGITVLATSLVLVLLQNFKTPERVLERKIEHRYVVSDPQFRREMSVMLGPSITRGNAVVALQNDSPREATINCDLVHNPTQVDLVDTRSVRLGIEDEADTGVNTLMALRTMSAAGSDDVFIRCTQPFAGTADAKHMRIIAMKVNN